MADAKEKRQPLPKFTSPRSIFRFPKLTDPDYGTKDYPKKDGEFSVQGLFTQGVPTVEEFLAKLAEKHDEAIAKAKEEFAALKVETRKAFEKKGITGPVVNPLFKELYDKETEEPTGQIAMKFSMKYSGTRKEGDKEKKWTQRPSIFDAKGVVMKTIPNIWGGSEGKIAFKVAPYFIPGTAAAGLSLKLTGVQILKLVAQGMASAESMGFEEEEGFEYDESAFQDESSSSETSAPKGDAAGDDDF